MVPGETALINCQIAGAGALDKINGGTLALGGNNSYSSTIVTAGTLEIQSGSALPTGSVLVVDGGNVDLGGNSVGAEFGDIGRRQYSRGGPGGQQRDSGL